MIRWDCIKEEPDPDQDYRYGPFCPDSSVIKQEVEIETFSLPKDSKSNHLTEEITLKDEIEALDNGDAGNPMSVDNAASDYSTYTNPYIPDIKRQHPEKERKPRIQYKRFKYSPEVLVEAVQAIKAGTITLNEASRKYCIPKSTLSDKANDKVPLERKMGPATILTNQEEQDLNNWLIRKAKIGFPFVAEDLKDSIQNILEERSRPNPFKNNRPGDTWMSLFLKRYPEIKKINTENISKARAIVTKKSIKCWFRELNQFLKANRCCDIFNDPRRILNCDETGCLICPSTGKILGPKNLKDLYEVRSGKVKKSITVLCTYSADSSTLPSMVVYPFSVSSVKTMPQGWTLGRSDSGWIVSAIFYRYVSKILKPWLEENKVPFPVILFLDGHKSHLSLEFSKFCAANKIIIYCLPPNASHIIQPCDVSIFRSLMVAWKKIIHKANQLQTVIDKDNFAHKFKEAFDAVEKETIIDSFRACGLYPLNKDAVDYSKCISESRN